jgi:rubrerythrin
MNMTRTEENIKQAFAGESQASRKYKSYADKADKEGFKQVAKLFRAASEAEMIHAANDLMIMKAVNSTEENLKTALEGETFEYTKMYPEFIEDAKSDGNKAAGKIFQDSSLTEEIHASYYKDALDLVKQNKDIPESEYYVCAVCGHTAVNEAPTRCPICGSGKKSFKEVE